MLLESLRNTGVLNPLENSKIISTPTGFTAIDLLGATIENDTEYLPRLNQGLCNKFYMNTGESGTGKSTLKIQTSCYGVDYWNSKYPETQPSDLIIIDAEDFTTSNRVITLSHWTPEYMNRHLSLRKDTNLTDIYNLILKIVDMKSKNKDTYYVDTDILDVTGTRVKTWIPTYILIDSLAAVKAGIGLENVDRDKSGEIKEMAITQNIDAMREAKENTGFIMKVKPLCNEYGIILSLINHITKDSSMSMFDIPKRYLITLKPGEKLRGGYELIYQAYGIDNIRLKEKLTASKNPVYGEKIEGGIMDYTYLKSKNKGEGIPYRLVMDKNDGYKPELSDFEYLYSVNYGFSGAGIGLSLDILPEVKFSKKNLEEKCHEHPELARALQFTTRAHIIATLLLERDNGPNLDFIKEMDYNQRIAYIFAYTTRYPGYGAHSIPEELAVAIANGQMYLPKNVDLSNSFVDDLVQALLISESDLNPVFMADKIALSDFQSIYDDPSNFIIDGEFWFKK